MNQEQDLMSRMKRLIRVDKEGGSMSPEERTWFENTNKASDVFLMQVKVSINAIKPPSKNL